MVIYHPIAEHWTESQGTEGAKPRSPENDWTHRLYDICHKVVSIYTECCVFSNMHTNGLIT